MLHNTATLAFKIARQPRIADTRLIYHYDSVLHIRDTLSTAYARMIMLVN